MYSLPIFFAVITAILWSIPPIVQKILVVETNPEIVLVFGAIIYVIVALIYGVMHWDRIRAAIPTIMKPNFLAIAIFSTVVGAFLGNILFLNVLQNHSSHIVVALAYASPLFVFIWNLIMTSQAITWRSFVGIFAVVFGCILLVVEDRKTKASTTS